MALVLRGVARSFGDQSVFDDVSLELPPGAKLARVGSNGSGKSTLIAALLGRLPPAGGTCSLAPGVSVYWAGQHAQELGAFRTVREALLDAQAALRPQDLHHLPSRPEQRIEELSGGQRTRLGLARLAVTRAQLLVLDEPTNHLDLEALEVLLVAYPGTLLFASHDRRLVERVATRVVDLGQLTPGGEG